MKIWTDREGNKLTFKEFMQRWKEGIEGITPVQQTVTQIYSTVITLIGIIAGIVITIINIETTWWLLIILVGAFGNTSVQLLGLYQKKILLGKFTINFSDIEKEVEHE